MDRFFLLPGYQRHRYREDGHILPAHQVLANRVLVLSRLIRLIYADDNRDRQHSGKHHTIDRIERPLRRTAATVHGCRFFPFLSRGSRCFGTDFTGIARRFTTTSESKKRTNEIEREARGRRERSLLRF